MEEPKKRKRKNIFKFIMLTAILVVMGGIGFYGINRLNSDVQESTAKAVNESTKDGITTENFSIAETVTGSAVTSIDKNRGVSEIADAVLPSIVQIQVKSTQTVNDILGRVYEQEQSGMGSGVIIGQDESQIFIVTNSHVVLDAEEVTIQFNDEKTAKATVKGTDSIADLAVVTVKMSDLSNETISNIRIAQTGSSNDAKVGQQVVAVGNALGYGTSVTVGCLSAKEREVQFEDGTRTLLQTDAAINPGNSGGALVDMSGRMIGINCGGVVSVEVEGINYAIPISDAMPIINRLMTQSPKSKGEQAYLGITGREVDSQTSEQYNIPEGIYINEVSKGSPAEKAGLKSGDIITAIEGRNVKNTTQMQEQLSIKSPGDKISLTVKTQKNGQYVDNEVSVTLSSRPMGTGN